MAGNDIGKEGSMKRGQELKRALTGGKLWRFWNNWAIRKKGPRFYAWVLRRNTQIAQEWGVGMWAGETKKSMAGVNY